MDVKTFDEKRNLIVNYLPSNLTQDEVQRLFSRIGPVSNCKLIRNFESGQSLGYAFIEYPSENLALEAINTLDGTKMEGKTLKVSYARQSSPDIKNSNVYVAGLPDHVSENDLYTLFTPFGKIITHKLLTNSDKTSKGVGFVRYSLKSEAQNAIECMGGKVLDKCKTPLTVKLAIPPVSKQQNSLLASTSQINAMAGIPGVSALRGSLRFNPLAPSNQAITHTGQVLSAISSLEQQTLSPIANPALIQLKTTQQVIPNATTASLTPASASQAFTIYIYGLQVHHNELHLYELFAPFGAILNVKLIRDLKKEDKPSKGYGFINFRKYEDSLAAINSLNNQVLEGKVLQVSFKNAASIGLATVQQQHQQQAILSSAGLQPSLQQQQPQFQARPHIPHHHHHHHHQQQHHHLAAAGLPHHDSSPLFSNFHHMKYPN